MATTTLGVKLNSQTQTRLKMAAENLDRTPHWFMKIAILELIQKVESGTRIEGIIDEKFLREDTDKNSVAMRNRREKF